MLQITNLVNSNLQWFILGGILTTLIYLVLIGFWRAVGEHFGFFKDWETNMVDTAVCVWPLSLLFFLVGFGIMQFWKIPRAIVDGSAEGFRKFFQNATNNPDKVARRRHSRKYEENYD